MVTAGLLLCNVFGVFVDRRASGMANLTIPIWAAWRHAYAKVFTTCRIFLPEFRKSRRIAELPKVLGKKYLFGKT